MRVFGIDPGVNGGCALYIPGSDGPTVPDGVFNIPTVGDGNKREIDGLLLSRMIWALRPDYAFVEIVNAFMPKKKNPETGEEEIDRWGGTSLFRFGGAYHSILTVLSCLEIPTRRIRAPEWQGCIRDFRVNQNQERMQLDKSCSSAILLMLRI